MRRSLFAGFRCLVIILASCSFLLSPGVIVPATGFAKPTTASQTNPTWTATGNLLLARSSFSATTLPNGQVLIEGGYDGSYPTESELFDSAMGVWTQTGNLNQGRTQQSATLLQNGQVLVAGGYAGPVLNSAELYNPATGIWTLTGSMSQVRTRHTATLLTNGQVLVAGGWDGDMVASAELYDSATGNWSSAGNMATPRADHVAVLLPNGQVLVAGGAPVNAGFTNEAELYDPNTNTWTPTGSMNMARQNFTAVLLSNGKVLAIGGSTPTGATATAELYDPATGTWTLTGSMQVPRITSQGQQALVLADGTVLMAGDDTPGTSEVYNPSTSTWGSLTNMVSPHCGAATTLLSDGQALISGGTDCASNLTTVTELYSSSPTPGENHFYVTATKNYGLLNYAAGMVGRFGIYQPTVPKQTNAYSIAQMAAISPRGVLTDLEVGWIVYPMIQPTGYGDTKPHLFIFTRYLDSSLYEHWCNLFKDATTGSWMCHDENGNNVQTDFVAEPNPPAIPGKALAVTNTPQQFFVAHTDSKWYIGFKGQLIGYFPDSHWGGSFASIAQSQWYGEVVSPTNQPIEQMGNGICGSQSGSAIISNIRKITSFTVSSSTSFSWKTVNVTPKMSDPTSAYYNYGHNYLATNGYTFTYGGYGINTVCQ